MLPVTSGLEDVFSPVFKTFSIITLLLQAFYSAAHFFSLFFSFILNGLDQDLTIHFWFQLAKLNLPAPPLLTITFENRDVWQVSQFHEVEAVSKQRRKSLCDGSVAQRLHWNLLVFTAWIWHERGLAWYPSSMVIVLLVVSNNYHEPFPPFDFCGNCSIPR